MPENNFTASSQVLPLTCWSPPHLSCTLWEDTHRGVWTKLASDDQALSSKTAPQTLGYRPHACGTAFGKPGAGRSSCEAWKGAEGKHLSREFVISGARKFFYSTGGFGSQWLIPTYGWICHKTKIRAGSSSVGNSYLTSLLGYMLSVATFSSYHFCLFDCSSVWTEREVAVLLCYMLQKSGWRFYLLPLLPQLRPSDLSQ